MTPLYIHQTPFRFPDSCGTCYIALKKNADSEKFLTCFKLITCECVRAQFKRLKKNESVENQMFLVTYERRKPSRNRNSGVKGASVKKQKQTCCVPVQVLFESIKRKSLTSFMVSFFP